MTETVRVERHEQAVTIHLDRPEKYNALDVETSHELSRVIEACTDTPVPIVFGSSTPGMFVSGTDMHGLRTRSVAQSLGRINSKLMQQVWDHPWPTIAVVDGPALGGGFELALACDFRIASTRSSWGLPEVRLGLVPSAGGLSRLPQVVGWTMATELILTGRRIDAEGARAAGLVNAVTEPAELQSAVRGLLEELAAASAPAVRLAKEAMRVGGDRDRLVDALAQALCLARSDTQERIDRVINRS